MSGNSRINIRLSCDSVIAIKRLAKERNQTAASLVRDAVGVLQTAHIEGKKGRYLGLTPNRENLETLLVLP